MSCCADNYRHVARHQQWRHSLRNLCVRIVRRWLNVHVLGPVTYIRSHTHYCVPRCVRNVRLQAPANGVLSRPVTLRQALAHNHDWLRVRTVTIAELMAAEQWRLE